MVLYKWFGAGEDKVPPYGNTQVGCAGFVVNEKNEILVVKEWQSANDGADRVPSPNWKLPGGLADRGESFFECAARETLEETGVACRAVSVLGMWHRHGVQPWGKSDIYCVVRLELLGPLAIDADPSDGLPNVVCPECVNALDFWYVSHEFLYTLGRRLSRDVLLCFPPEVPVTNWALQ